MRKIPTLFRRNPENMRELLPEVTPGCEWVLEGEGVATRKYNGACCMIRDGAFFKRREIKQEKPVPASFEEVEHDETTGKRFGWMPVTDGPEDKYFREAHEQWLEVLQEEDGTYELVGPKVQGNAEGFLAHVLVRHGTGTLGRMPRDFSGLQLLLSSAEFEYEGIVWHHPDGRMAKIKKRNFA